MVFSVLGFSEYYAVEAVEQQPPGQPGSSGGGGSGGSSSGSGGGSVGGSVSGSGTTTNTNTNTITTTGQCKTELVHIVADNVEARPGNVINLNVYVRNIGSCALDSVSFTIEVPEGWTATSAEIGTLEPGQEKLATLAITPTGAEGLFWINLVTGFEGGESVKRVSIRVEEGVTETDNSIATELGNNGITEAGQAKQALDISADIIVAAFLFVTIALVIGGVAMHKRHKKDMSWLEDHY